MGRKPDQHERAIMDKFPVLQNFHTGGWGWERVYDCLDLSRTVYATERACTIARNRYARAVAAGERRLEDRVSRLCGSGASDAEILKCLFDELWPHRDPFLVLAAIAGWSRDRFLAALPEAVSPKIVALYHW